VEQPNIFEIVTGLLSRVSSYPVVRMEATTSLRDDLGVGSLEMLELVMELEHELGISVQDGEFSEVRTIGDVVETARSLLEKTRAS
jgi:acyl carrier protein